MEVWIAEKAKQARAIVTALGGSTEAKNGAMTMPGGRCMVWGSGHLLELARPEDYDPGWTWSPSALRSMPFEPQVWRKRITEGQDRQVQAVVRHLKKATSIVVASDADAEGELIVRELMEWAKVGATIPVRRLWLNALNAQAVRKAAQELREGHTTEGLARAAEVRERVDWTLGMSATILVTLKCRPQGVRGVYSIGRVQSPTLALVVEREETREQFVPEPVQTLEATVSATRGRFVMTHRPEPRVGEREEIERRRMACTGVESTLTIEKKRTRKSPPKPLCLSTLQQIMSRTSGWSAKRTLDVAQTLYERGAVTYPRTDAEAFEESDFAQACAAWEGLWGAEHPWLAGVAKPTQWMRRNTVFNDKKLEKKSHHAIRTDGVTSAQTLAGWTPDERALYEWIARRFVQQTLPEWERDETKVSAAARRE